jgi:hypothetical protein
MDEMRIRKSNRLKGYSYSNLGCYFITICTKKRHEILGSIVGDAHRASHSLHFSAVTVHWHQDNLANQCGNALITTILYATMTNINAFGNTLTTIQCFGLTMYIIQESNIYFMTERKRTT